MGDYLVKAHSDYEATQDDELTLKAGDIVKVTNKDDPDWWQGEMIGRSGNGLFPSNFVEPLSESHIEKDDSENQDSRQDATQHGPKLANIEEEYVAQTPDELTLLKGGVVTVLEQHEGWWKGEFNGKTGRFPPEFVKLVEEEEVLTTEEDKSTKPAFKLAAYGVKQGGLGSLFAGGGMPLLKKTGKKLGDDASSHAAPAPIAKPPTFAQARQASVEVPKPPMNTVPTPASAPTAKVTPKAIVTHHYDADNEDEISLMKGEYVTILDRDADEGWYKGTNERGETGLFPASFVMELEEEVPPPIRSRTRSPEARKSVVEERNVDMQPTHSPPPIPTAARPPSVVSVISTSRPNSIAEQHDVVTSPTHVHHPPLPAGPPPKPATPLPARRPSSMVSEVGSVPLPPHPHPPMGTRPRPLSMVSPDLPPLSPKQDIHGTIHNIPPLDEAAKSLTAEEDHQLHTKETIEQDRPRLDPVASMAKPPKFLPKGAVPLPGLPPRPMLSGNGPSSPTDEATTPKSSSRPTSLHEAALPAPPRPLSIPSEVSPPPSIPQRRASTRSSLPPPPAEPVEFIPDPRSRASIVEEDITEQIKEDEEEIQVTVDATTTSEVEENVEAKQEPDEDAQDDIVEESVLVENTMKAAEDLDDSVNMGEADIHLGREHEESKIDMVEQNDNIVAKEEESPKRPELPELPSGPKLAPTPRARPARGRRAPSEQSIKEAGPSQTAVLENDVTKISPQVEEPKPEPAARSPPVPPAKPTKPIFNKFPTPFAGVKGELPNIPLKPVQRRMFEPVPALPDKEPNATHSEDKDSTTSTAPPAGGVRSLQNRFNFAAPQGSGSNDVLETKLKNFVRQEIDRLKKEFEAQLADERTARQLLEEEIKALKERLSE